MVGTYFAGYCLFHYYHRPFEISCVKSIVSSDHSGVYPIADLHELDGLKHGFVNPIAMADGYGFIGAKAYKDSKLCLMMMSNFLHTKYNKLTGISFSSMYPGCIAESPLFREKRAWFRKYFPIFMKFITGKFISLLISVFEAGFFFSGFLTYSFYILAGGFVGEHEAGQRLFQVVHDPRCSKSGVYWSWNGGPREGRGAEALEKGGQISGGGGAGGGWDSIFENDQSAKVLDVDTAIKLFQYSTEITEAEWPSLKAVTSPCPTLNVIGAVTKGMVKREELKRMREMGRPGIVEGEPVKITKAKKVVLVADKVVGSTLKHTIGRVARFVGRRLLGDFPEEAVSGTFVESGSIKKVVLSDPTQLEIDAQDLLQEVSAQLEISTATPVVDSEDEALFQQIFEKDSEPQNVSA